MISIVLTSFNYASFLPRAIDAVLQQSIKPSEFIIIDDDSSDGSVDIIQEYARSHSQIKVVRNDCNKGVIWSINHGLEIATNPYILFSTADDIIFPDLIEKSLTLLKRYPQAGFFTASAKIINKEGRQTETWRDLGTPKKEFINQADSRNRMQRYGFWFVGATTVFRRQLLIEANGFKPELGHYCDSFISQVLALRHGYCYSSKPLAAVRIVESSYSQTIKNNIQKEQELQGNVIRIMRSDYSDLFPSNFIDEWGRINKLMSAIYAWRVDILKKQMLFLNEKISLIRPKPNWIDIFFNFILKTLSWSQFFIFSMYFTIIYGRGRLFFQYISLSRLRFWLNR